MEKSERPVAAGKARAWRKAGKRQPDDAQWDIVLAEYRDPNGGTGRSGIARGKVCTPGSSDGASKVFGSIFLRN